MNDDNCQCPCCRARRENNLIDDPNSASGKRIGGTISYATEEEKNDQRRLAELARQKIAKRRSEW